MLSTPKGIEKFNKEQIKAAKRAAKMAKLNELKDWYGESIFRIYLGYWVLVFFGIALVYFLMYGLPVIFRGIVRFVIDAQNLQF